jgi:thioredoxin reductase
MDVLPDISGIKEFYGTSVHHCPYCDGWEHKDQRLIALGRASTVAKLAMTLAAWSKHVTACTNGEQLSVDNQSLLRRHGINYRQEPIGRLYGDRRALKGLEFADSMRLPAEALFFSSDQSQRSQLPRLLGCDYDEEDLVVTHQKQCTSVEGVFIAGDADGDVQFAIVAAAEGAIAATAIHEYLLKQEQR